MLSRQINLVLTGGIVACPLCIWSNLFKTVIRMVLAQWPHFLLAADLPASYLIYLLNRKREFHLPLAQMHPLLPAHPILGQAQVRSERLATRC